MHQLVNKKALYKMCFCSCRMFIVWFNK